MLCCAIRCPCGGAAAIRVQTHCPRRPAGVNLRTDTSSQCFLSKFTGPNYTLQMMCYKSHHSDKGGTYMLQNLAEFDSSLWLFFSVYFSEQRCVIISWCNCNVATVLMEIYAFFPCELKSLINTQLKMESKRFIVPIKLINTILAAL